MGGERIKQLDAYSRVQRLTTGPHHTGGLRSRNLANLYIIAKITGFVGRTALCMIARPRSDRQLGRSFTRSQCFSIEALNDSLGDGSRGSEGACFASEIRNAQLSLIR